MNVHIRPLVAGALLVSWASLLGCGSDSDPESPQESLGTGRGAVFSSGDPTTVVAGSPLTRSPTCPQKKLPDQCGSWAGVELSASRSYWPPRATDDEHCLCAPIEFQIPASLPVVDGNSGAGLTELSFRKTNGKTVHCFYQGNQRLSRGKPVGGTTYDFQVCSDLSKVGATVKADWFSLEMHGGNPLNGPTTVNVKLGEPDVVDGVVQEQIFYSDDSRIPGAALYVPRGSAPAQQDFTLDVLPQVAVGTTIANAGLGFKTAGYAVDVHASGVDTFNFTPVPGAACARIELPYNPQALAAGQEQRLQARQITSLAAVGSGASSLASAGPVTVDPVRHTATFCVDHLSYYVTGATTGGTTLTGAWIAETPLTGCTTPAQCASGQLCVANSCYFNALDAAPPALRPNTTHNVRLQFLNNGTAWTTGDLKLWSMAPRSTPPLPATLARSPWFPLLTSAYVQTYLGTAPINSGSSLVFDVPVTTPIREGIYGPNAYGSILNLCLQLDTAWLNECFSFDYPPHAAANTGTGNAQLYEICDGIDNDGVAGIDNGSNDCLGVCALAHPKLAPCDNGELGVCRITGQYLCAGPNATVCNAASGSANAGPEVCNDVDDDCDGELNEGGVCWICTPGTVDCNGVSKRTCSDDGLQWVDNGIVVGACGVECLTDESCGACNTGLRECTGFKWQACQGGSPIDFYADADGDEWCSTSFVSKCESERPEKTRTRAECVDSTWGFRSDCLDSNGFVQNGCCEKRIYSEMYYKDCCGGPETRTIDYDCGEGWHTASCSLDRVEGFGKTSKYFWLEECGDTGQRFGRMSVYYALDFLEGVEGRGIVHCVPDGLDAQPSYCPIF